MSLKSHMLQEGHCSHCGCPPFFSVSPSSDTHLLDCSCNGMVALALGSSVYLWNSQTRSLAGHLEQTAPSGQPSDHWAQSISCLCWSGDGRTLCIGTRGREIQVLQMWNLKGNKFSQRETECGLGGCMTETSTSS